MKKVMFILSLSFTALLVAQIDTLPIQENTVFDNKQEEQIQNKIDKEINSLNKDILTNREKILNNENTIADLFITRIGTQGLLLTLFLTFFSIFGIHEILKNRVKKSEEALKKEFEDSINNVKEAEIRTIRHIKNAEKENEKLRDQSQILLISEVSTAMNPHLHRTFIQGSSKVEFNCTEIKVKELTYKSIKKELINKKKPFPVDFELVIIDNSNADGRKWGQSYIDEHIIPLTKELLNRGIGMLYYSNDLFYPSRDSEYKNIPNQHLLNFANVGPNLYYNAMMILKLQNLYKE